MGISRCLAILAGARDDVALIAVTETMLAVLEAMAGKFDEARERRCACRRRLQDVGLSVTLAALAMYSAFIELMAGSPANAENEVAEAYVLLKRIGERRRLPTTAALLARLLYAQGRYEEAEHFGNVTAETASEDDVVSQVDLARHPRQGLRARAGKTVRAESLTNSAPRRWPHRPTSDAASRTRSATARRCFPCSDVPSPRCSRPAREAIALYERKGIRAGAEAARPRLLPRSTPRRPGVLDPSHT